MDPKADNGANGATQIMSRLFIEKLKAVKPGVGNGTFVEIFKRTPNQIISYLSCKHARKSITGSCPVKFFRPGEGFLEFEVNFKCTRCDNEFPDEDSDEDSIGSNAFEDSVKEMKRRWR